MQLVPEGPAHGLIVHVGLVLVFPPQTGDGLGVDQLEDARPGVGPFDVARADLAVLKELHEELPQVQRVPP